MGYIIKVEPCSIQLGFIHNWVTRGFEWIVHGLMLAERGSYVISWKSSYSCLVVSTGPGSPFSKVLSSISKSALCGFPFYNVSQRVRWDSLLSSISKSALCGFPFIKFPRDWGEAASFPFQSHQLCKFSFLKSLPGIGQQRRGPICCFMVNF
jgi:hypothetical protein